jgi:hypothetical protein
MLILPGYDSMNGNTNSFLYKTFGEKCSTYVLTQPLESQTSILNKDATRAVVHSYGFFIFWVGYQKGLFPNVESLVVFDGYFPKDEIFHGEEFKVGLLPLKTVYFFPTVGDRSSYKLEGLMKGSSRSGMHIVRGVGFGHNLLFQEFDIEKAKALTLNLCLLVDEPETEERNVVFPAFTLTE